MQEITLDLVMQRISFSHRMMIRCGVYVLFMNVIVSDTTDCTDSESILHHESKEIPLINGNKKSTVAVMLKTLASFAEGHLLG